MCIRNVESCIRFLSKHRATFDRMRVICISRKYSFI